MATQQRNPQGIEKVILIKGAGKCCPALRETASPVVMAIAAAAKGVTCLRLRKYALRVPGVLYLFFPVFIVILHDCNELFARCQLKD